MDSLIRQGHAGSYYGGTVKVSEGALPWDPILVNVVCNGETKFTTATDPKGNFLIAPKQGDAAANAAASTPNGPAATSRINSPRNMSAATCKQRCPDTNPVR